MKQKDINSSLKLSFVNWFITSRRWSIIFRHSS